MQGIKNGEKNHKPNFLLSREHKRQKAFCLLFLPGSFGMSVRSWSKAAVGSASGPTAVQQLLLEAGSQVGKAGRGALSSLSYSLKIEI
jgi:hypothetical protein